MMQFEKVSYRYPMGQEALSDLSFDLNDGRCIGLIGPSGAGKSTIFNLLLGTIRPSFGSVNKKYAPISYGRKNQRDHFKDVGLVFQNPEDQLLNPMVFDEVAYGYKNLGTDLHKTELVVKMALEAVKLKGYEKRYVQSLSFGEKKRLSVASILVMSQPLVLLDEPTAGLDPRAVAQMVTLIQELTAKGIRTLIASHDMNFIAAVCDQVFLIDQGQLIIKGCKEKVFSDVSLLENSGLEQPYHYRKK